jgi:hypothetical protein
VALPVASLIRASLKPGDDVIRCVNQERWRKRRFRRGVLFPCVTALVLGLLLLTSCGPADQQPASTSVTGAWLSVHMIDTSVGWAESWDVAGSGAYLILRTTDGGRQ